MIIPDLCDPYLSALSWSFTKGARPIAYKYALSLPLRFTYLPWPNWSWQCVPIEHVCPWEAGLLKVHHDKTRKLTDWLTIIQLWTIVLHTLVTEVVTVHYCNNSYFCVFVFGFIIGFFPLMALALALAVPSDSIIQPRCRPPLTMTNIVLYISLVCSI